jgi:hypothetical protein
MAIFRAKNTLLREEHGQMARAKRHFLPGHVWHITHRCHKKKVTLFQMRNKERGQIQEFSVLLGYSGTGDVAH